MANFKTNLQQMRKRAGFKSAKAFAEHIGMSADTYTSYEQGKTQMSLLKAWEFADLLNCSLDELAGRKNPNEIQQLDSDEERRLVDAYRNVDDSAKRRIMRMVDGELDDADEGALKNAGIA